MQIISFSTGAPRTGRGQAHEAAGSTAEASGDRMAAAEGPTCEAGTAVESDVCDLSGARDGIGSNRREWRGASCRGKAEPDSDGRRRRKSMCVMVRPPSKSYFGFGRGPASNPIYSQ